MLFFFSIFSISLLKMKRAGTTGSARGMALYEEEVSAEENGKIELKPQTGFDISPFSPSLAPFPLFLPKPPTCWFLMRGALAQGIRT